MTEIDDLTLKNLLEHAHIGIIIHRWDTSILYANPTALRLMRLTYDQIIGKDAFDPQWCFLDDAGKKLLINDYPVNKVIRTGKRLSNEVIGVMDSSSEGISWFMINAYAEGNKDSDNRFVVITFNDISDSKHLFSFKEIVENTQDIVIVTEAENIGYPIGPKIIYVNKAFEELTGYKKDDVLGETPRILQGTLTSEKSKNRIHAALKDNLATTETLLNYDINGRPYWIEMNIIPLKNKYGDVTHFAAIERDISERKFHLEQLEKRNQDLKAFKKELENIVALRTIELQKANAKLEKIAFLDPLTNIPNRRFFIGQANKIINSCNRRNLMVAVGIIDIDDFKLLNDTYGHDLGDLVLKGMSNYLNQFFRNDDAFCRYGGEEFAFALAISTKNDLECLSKRLINGVRELTFGMEPSAPLSITISLGVKLSTATQSLDLEKEIKSADIALYHSKNEGKNRFTIIN